MGSETFEWRRRKPEVFESGVLEEVGWELNVFVRFSVDKDLLEEGPEPEDIVQWVTSMDGSND